MGGFPSGQRGQTVNLLQIASVVRIHLRPFDIDPVHEKMDGVSLFQRILYISMKSPVLKRWRVLSGRSSGKMYVKLWGHREK